MGGDTAAPTAKMPDVAEGDRLSCQGMDFQVREAMPVWWEGELLYWWGTLLPEREAAE